MMRASVLLFAVLLTSFSLLRPGEAFAQFNAFKDPSAGSTAGAVSGPDLKAVNDKIEGGKVTVGATAYVVAMFKNSGTSPVKVSGINLYPSSTVSAQVNLNKCADAPLPPDAQCAVTVAVTGLQIGSWRVEILLDHDGRTRLATAAMTGSVEGSGTQESEQVRSDIEAVPQELDFGSATGGIPMVKSILLRNRTSDKVNMTGIQIDTPTQSGFAYKTECPQQLAPSESCVIAVTWTPVTKGVSQAVLTVTHSAKSGLTKVDIKGSFDPTAATSAPIYPAAGSDTGVLVSDKDKVDFGTGIKSVSAITVSLVNLGSADLTLKSVGLAGSDNGLSVARSGCRAGTVLKPVEACALTVNWVPSREGAVIDDLQIMHTGARGVLILPIRGTADAAASRESLAVRQPSLDMQGGSDISAKTGKNGGHDGIRSEPPALTPVLDGYAVTAHSPSKAVINGPIGSLVVRDGEDVVISGVKWTVTIVSTGVILSSDDDEILLVFDKSLRPATPVATTTSSSSSTAASTTSTTAPATTAVTPAAPP